VAWLAGLINRQKALSKLCALKAADAQILEAPARMMDHYGPVEKPWCFLAIEGLLSPSAFWRAFQQRWASFRGPPYGCYLWTLRRLRRHWRADHLSPDDVAAYDGLPETLRLYRDREARTRVALSWRSTAVHREQRGEDGVLLKAKAPKAAVAGAYVGPSASRSSSSVADSSLSCRDALLNCRIFTYHCLFDAWPRLRSGFRVIEGGAYD
jgi:hypothetical protein